MNVVVQAALGDAPPDVGVDDPVAVPLLPPPPPPPQAATNENAMATRRERIRIDTLHASQRAWCIIPMPGR
jgi:hypothetical protein